MGPSPNLGVTNRRHMLHWLEEASLKEPDVLLGSLLLHSQIIVPVAPHALLLGVVDWGHPWCGRGRGHAGSIYFPPKHAPLKNEQRE